MSIVRDVFGSRQEAMREASQRTKICSKKKTFFHFTHPKVEISSSRKSQNIKTIV
jgi:hypothetical protein